jgi:hypothetical protein
MLNQMRIESSGPVFVLDKQMIVMGAVLVVVRVVVDDEPHRSGARCHNGVTKGDRKVIGELVVCTMVLRPAVSL